MTRLPGYFPLTPPRCATTGLGLAVLVLLLWAGRPVLAWQSAGAPARNAPAPTKGGPKVISRTKEKQQSRGSAFLRPPGDDRYRDDDWADVPAWRQTTFFGIHARGQFFI